MSSDNDNRNPFNAWWFVSGGFLVLVLVAVIVAVFAFRGAGDDNDANETPQPTMAQPETTGAAVEDGQCNLRSSDEYPTAGPDAEWELVANTMQLPRSPEHGPQYVEGESAECFAHSPTGALFAGMTRVIEVFYLGAADSAATDAASQQIAESYAEDPDEQGVQNASVITGFKFLDYAGDSASIGYRLEQAGTSAEMTVTVVWDESSGDWLVDLSAGEPGVIEVEPSDQSFVAWGP